MCCPVREMVKFAKDGSTVVSAAVKLARAHTGRVKVAICADHPFFSYNDWFMVTTGIPGGIPAEAADETVSFRYNDLAGAERLFAEHADDIACVVLEPARTEEPVDGFLHRLRDLAHRHGALFILDETITGFRWALGGGQEVYDVQPDLAAFGKALGNGFSVSALTGRREIMELGGLQHARERVFLLSTTHGAETHALAAAAKVIEIYRREDVIGALDRQGRRLESGVRQAIAHHGLERHFTLAGRPCAMLYGTRDAAGQPSAQFRTLFLQELIRRGVLAPSFMVSYSHDDADDRPDDRVGGWCTRGLPTGARRWRRASFGRAECEVGVPPLQLSRWNRPRFEPNTRVGAHHTGRARNSTVPGDEALAARARPPVVILAGGVTALGVMRAFGRRGVTTYVHPNTSEYIRHSRWYQPLLGDLPRSLARIAQRFGAARSARTVGPRARFPVRVQ